MSTGLWLLLAFGLALIALDVPLRRRGIIKDRSGDAKRLLAGRLAVFLVMAGVLTIAVLLT